MKKKMSKILAFALIVLSTYVTVHSENEIPIQIDNQLEFREGDMKFSRTRAFGLLGSSQQRWPGGVIPYEIVQNGYSSRQMEIIREGIALLNTKTGGCIKAVPRNNNHRNWIRIINGQGCWSYVGRFREGAGAQDVSLQAGGCTHLGTVVHEIMHALGFWHEQNRPDRDNYITVDLRNVDPKYQSNFNKYTGSQRQTFSRPYDLRSIMQYYEYSFSNNGRKTIIPKDNSVLVPVYRKTANQILTENDIQSVRDLYQCTAVNPVNPTVSPPVNPTVRPTIRPTVRPTVTPPVTEILPEGTRFSFTVDNDDRSTVRLYWKSYTGRWLRYALIRAGRSISQNTYVGHEWAITGRNIRTIRFIAGRGDLTRNEDVIHISEWQ